MEEDKVRELVDKANKVYKQLNRKIRSYGDNQKIDLTLCEIRVSLDEINRLSGEVEPVEGAEIGQGIDAVKKEEGAEEEIAGNGPELNDKSKNEESISRELVSNLENEDPKTLRRGPYRQYSQEIKQQVIELNRKGISFNRISRHMGIPAKNIVRWCKNGPQRKPGAGRKVLDPEMETKLYNWLFQKYKPFSTLKIQEIRQKAISLSSVEEFEASLGWLKNFLRRFNLKGMYKFN